MSGIYGVTDPMHMVRMVHQDGRVYTNLEFIYMYPRDRPCFISKKNLIDLVAILILKLRINVFQKKNSFCKETCVKKVLFIYTEFQYIEIK